MAVGIELVVQALPDQIDDARALLERTVSYILDSGRSIAPGDTMAIGSWLVRFTETRRATLELWQFNHATDDFVAGVDRALALWRDQQQVCQSAHAEFDPPPPHANVVVSGGVLEGDPSEGVRYRAPAHMSGWWVTTDPFDGIATSLRGEHVLTVCGGRPDLARYLALPPGYWFDTRIDQVWFS